MKRKIILLTALCISSMVFSGCSLQTEADKVSYNLSLEADNFNDVRSDYLTTLHM